MIGLCLIGGSLIIAAMCFNSYFNDPRRKFFRGKLDRELKKMNEQETETDFNIIEGNYKTKK